MGGSSKPKDPPPPVLPPPVPTQIDPRVRQARIRERARAARAGGRPMTILSSPRGVESQQDRRRAPLARDRMFRQTGSNLPSEVPPRILPRNI